MNNVVFGKTTDNVRKYTDIKRVTTERRKDYLVYEPNYHTTKFFIKKLVATDIKKSDRCL